MFSDTNIKQTSKTFIDKSISSTYIYLLTSLLSKFVNLFFTVLIIRVVSKQSFSLSKVYFEFIFSLIHFIPRETVRKACQKYSTDANAETELAKLYHCSQLNLLIVAITAILSVPLFFLFVLSVETLNDVKIHLILYISNALLEMIAEPVILVININLDDKLKLLITKASTYSRLTFNYILPLLFGLDLWAFTISRTIGSVLYVVVAATLAFFKYGMSISYFIPSITTISNLNPELLKITWSFFKITLVKAFLNFTEKFSLNFFLGETENNKGEYTFVVENCSLITKYMLEPLDENFYNLVSKLKNVNEHRDLKSEEDEEMVLDGNEITDLDFLRDRAVNQKRILKLMFKFMMIFTVMFIGFLYFAGKDLLVTLFTVNWATPLVIKLGFLYGLYVCFTGLANTVDTYVNAVASSRKIEVYSKYMLVVGILQFFLSITLPRINLSLLILCNSISIFFKFGYSSYVIFSEPREEDIRKGIADENGYFDWKKGLQIAGEFYSSATLKVTTFVSILLFMNVIELLSEEGQHDRNMAVSLLVLMVNILVVYWFEKKHIRRLFLIS